MNYFYLIAFSIAIVDQAIKFIVRTFMPPLHSIPIIPDVFYLTYVRNSGAAFGIFSGRELGLAVIGLCVMGMVVFFHYRISNKQYFVQLALAFIFGGSLGNMLDRVFLTYVVDYFDIKIFPAVFNLADMSINAGIAILVFYILFISKDGRKT